MGQAFELGPVLHGPIHKLRRTHKGIQNLQQTGRFREYMQAFVDSKNKPFVSWDGEGWTDTDGEHRYMLLQSSTGDYIDAPRLTTIECLEMIMKVGAENRKAIHVIYGGGYDATHILRDIPPEIMEGLKDNNPIIYDVPETDTQRRNFFKIRYLPHKWLDITGFDWESRTPVHIKIYDVMTFFQSSFIKALQSRKIEVDDVITSGKASRNTFTYQDIDEIRQYCQLELEYLVRLCNQLRSEFDEAGIYVTQFHGPGAVASAIFKEYGIREHMEAPTPDIERAAQHSYFGGHFEQYKAGHYDGKVWLYDINSAYPHNIRNLPSLKGSDWEFTTRYNPAAMGMWFCSFDTEGYNAPNPLPWRGRGGVVGFPSHNNGVWVWHHEAQFATVVHYGYTLQVDSDEKPFEFVNDMFETRRKWKREGKGGERAYKLALNSLYGKMAQRVGGSDNFDGRPPWHNLVWAGMVTSGTRSQIFEAVSQNPEAIIAVETDSVMSTVPLDLDFGDALGQWEVTEYDWVTYIQSGIYFTSGDDSGMKAKTRGIDVTQLDHDKVLKFLDGDQSEPMVIGSRNFIGLTNPRKGMYGQWQDSTKEVKVAGEKRIHSPGFCTACDHGYSMAERPHDLIAAPHYGITHSEPHPLPWVDGGVLPADPELTYAGDAIEEWDVARRVQK